MTSNPSLVTVGSIENGATLIQVDVTPPLGAAVAVILQTEYQVLAPPGYVTRPGFTGAAQLDYPREIASGTTITVLQPEATALINAGAAVLA